MAKRKANPFDYTGDMLPKNRKEVFRDLVHLQFLQILRTGFILLLFSIPLQLVGILKEMTAAAVYRDLAGGILSAEDAATALVTLSNQAALIAIPLWLLFGLGLAGVMQLLKRLAWALPTTGIHDFLTGVRQNAQSYAALFLLIGLLSYVSKAAGNYATMVEQEGIYGFLGIVPSIFFLILLFPIGAYAAIAIPIYNTRFGSQIRLGLYLYMKSPFRTLFSLCGFGIFAAVLIIPDFYVHTTGRILLAVALPFFLLKWFLIVSDVLDRHWNRIHYPDLVNRGVLGAVKGSME